MIHDTSKRTITIDLKKSGATAVGESTSGAVDLKKKYTVTGGTAQFHANSKIVVYFTAKLNAQAKAGTPGNYNWATLEFRNAKGEYLTTKLTIELHAILC